MGLRDRLGGRRVQRELRSLLGPGERVRATGAVFVDPVTVTSSQWQARRVALPGVYRGARSLLAPGRSLGGTISATDEALYVTYREDGMRLAASDLVRIDFTEVETLHWSPQPAPARRNGYLTVEFSGSRIEAFVIMNTDPYWPATRGRPAQARHAA